MMLFDVTFFLEVMSPPAMITFTLSFFNKPDNDLDNTILSDLPSTITTMTFFFTISFLPLQMQIQFQHCQFHRINFLEPSQAE